MKYFFLISTYKKYFVVESQNYKEGRELNRLSHIDKKYMNLFDEIKINIKNANTYDGFLYFTNESIDGGQKQVLSLPNIYRDDSDSRTINDYPNGKITVNPFSSTGHSKQALFKRS